MWEYGIAQESEWTQEQCFTVLAKCAVKKDLEGCVQIFRQWHALLMTEQQEHIARLEQECSKHKRAAISAQKTCEHTQRSLTVLQTKVEMLEKQGKKSHDQPKVRLYPSLKQFKGKVEAQSSGDSDSDDSVLDLKILEAAPVVVKQRKVKGEKDVKVSIKHVALSPEQIDRMAKEFKHPREMGISPFLTLMTRKIKLYSLHPRDVISICSQVLMPDEMDKMETFYEACADELESLKDVDDCNACLLVTGKFGFCCLLAKSGGLSSEKE